MTPRKRSSIHTLGYSGWNVDAVASLLERLDAVLVDVRMSPRSRNSDYSGKRLAERLGERYVHVRELGNSNYRGGPIRLVDFKAGALRVEELIDAGRTCVVMCACADVNICHRKHVAEALGNLWGLDVVHLDPPGAETDAGQGKLF